MSVIQLDFFSQPQVSDLCSRARASGVLPPEGETAHLAPGERAELCQAWMEGMSRARDEIARAEVMRFKARGWPFRWLAEWNPVTDAGKALSDAIEEAIDVVDRTYAKVLARGMTHDEDMGIVQVQAFGKSEGVAVKREAYGQLILVSVHCVTGPRNFDPSTGKVEFESGSRSHVFHLVYPELPSQERLAGDIAAYPVIKSANNILERRHQTWMSEGWTGLNATRPKTHRPWDTIPPLV